MLEQPVDQSLSVQGDVAVLALAILREPERLLWLVPVGAVADGEIDEPADRAVLVIAQRVDAAEVECDQVGLAGVVLGDVDVAALELIDVRLARPVLHPIVEQLVEPRPQRHRDRQRRAC